MKYLVILAVAVSVGCLASGCSKKNDSPGSGADSILVKPTTEFVPESQPQRDTASGLLIDQSRYYTPEQQALLNRFDPIQVVNIYHDFKSIRKPGLTQQQLDSFAQIKKINVAELKAILQEGDRRGWSGH
ncbi:MAG: hypothetical protein WCH46_06270 [bacterium]